MFTFMLLFTIVLLLPGVAHSQPVPLGLDSVFVAVKTSGKFHSTRLRPVLDTWYRTAPTETWFFTDIDDPALTARTGGHAVNTGCPEDHSRTALSCKMEAELSKYLESDRPWFCHVDDDNYLNSRQLVKMLAQYPANKDWYLGKVSIPQPLELLDRLALPATKKVRFWFATGGAGFCLSRPLAEKMRPWIVDGQFQKLADDIRLPDDVAVGYLTEVLLGVPLVQVPQFHSHLEPLRLVAHLETEVTLSYSTYEDTREENVVEVEQQEMVGKVEGLEQGVDNTRFYAIHCRLNPEECGGHSVQDP